MNIQVELDLLLTPGCDSSYDSSIGNFPSHVYDGICPSVSGEPQAVPAVESHTTWPTSSIQSISSDPERSPRKHPFSQAAFINFALNNGSHSVSVRQRYSDKRRKEVSEMRKTVSCVPCKERKKRVSHHVTCCEKAVQRRLTFHWSSAIQDNRVPAVAGRLNFV